MDKLLQHSHQFVESYDGLVGFGWDRATDEKTVMYYLQKFSDDQLLAQLVPRLQDDELDGIFSMLTQLLRKHLSETEYHRLFLKEDHSSQPPEVPPPSVDSR